MPSPERPYRDNPEAEQAYVASLEAENARLREELDDAKRAVIRQDAFAEINTFGEITQEVKDLRRQVGRRPMHHDIITVLVLVLGTVTTAMWVTFH